MRPRKPIGTVSFNRTKEGNRRAFVKVAHPAEWEERAKVVWKKQYGFILPGDIVHHLNGDRLQDRKGNLLALPRPDHVRLHNRWGLVKLSKKEIETYLKRYKNGGNGNGRRNSH